MNIGINLPSGTISIFVPAVDCHLINDEPCVMIPCIEQLIRQATGKGYEYTFYTTDVEEPFKHYVPLNTTGIFALASEPQKNKDMLHTCVRHANKNDISRLLMRYMTRFNTTDGRGHTPLYVACIHRNAGIIQDLLDKGADPHRRCGGYLTPYDYCNTSKRVSRVYEQILDMF